MRALSYMIVLVLVLARPSLAGSAERDVPGVGSFVYCGAPIMIPVPELLAGLGR